MNNEAYLFFLIYVYNLKNDIRKTEKVIKKETKNNDKYS